MSITAAHITGTGTVVEGSTYTANLSATSTGGPAAITGWTLNWGDGSAPQNFSGNPASETHVYANDTGTPFTITGTVSDQVGSYSGSMTTTAQVSATEAVPSFLAWVPGTNYEGQTVSLSHTFSDAGGDTVTSYSTDWGDGTVNSSFTHTYAEESSGGGTGTYRIRLTANTTDSGTYSAITTGAALHVLDAALSATPINGQASVGVAFSGNVSTFTDANPNGSTGDFSGLINWGDGTTASTGVITSNGAGGWNVSGIHTYSASGSFTESVTITDVGGSTVLAAPTIAVTSVASISAGDAQGNNSVHDVSNKADVYIKAKDSAGDPISMAGENISIKSLVPAAGGAAISGTDIHDQNVNGAGVDVLNITFPASLVAGTDYTLTFSLDSKPTITCSITVHR